MLEIQFIHYFIKCVLHKSCTLCNYFRNTVIGNGKGKTLVEVNGKLSEVKFNGTNGCTTLSDTGFVLQSYLKKTDVKYNKSIRFVDSDGGDVGLVGFASLEDNIFTIQNKVSAIKIHAVNAVDIYPKILENGVSLSDKYVLKTHFNNTISELTSSSNVYSKTDADKTFSKLSGGLSQFVTGTATKEIIRQQIDAASLAEVLKKAPELTKYLSDMATDVNAKKKICENIGAAYGGDFQPKMKDSGWIKIKDELHIRQIGNIVSIQGYLTTTHSATAFTIPPAFDSPTYAVTFSTIISPNAGLWSCQINNLSRNCIVDYCNNHGVRIPFSMTYMV